MAKVNLKSIYKQYDNAKDYAVKDFNLDVDDQEFIVFVGPSGCGKSTTLRMVAGLEDISKGELSIAGEVMNDVPPKNRDIAMVFQDYALYPHMTVYENMAFGLEIRKLPKEEIEERVQQSAEMVGLEDLLDRKPSELSGGQRQRVALGRATVRNPKVFLMDEPLSNLDAKLRVKMRTQIKKLHNELDVTTIYVTHDQTEAMTLADRIVIMNEGTIQQIGAPLDVYSSPNNKFVAGFIGSPAMNFFDVRYEDGFIYFENGESLPVTLSKQTQLDNAGYNGKEMTFGIRPEDIHAENIALKALPDAIISPTLVHAELTGSDAILYLDYKGLELEAVVDARDYSNRHVEVKLALDMNKAHYFDKTTEETILKRKVRD